MESLYILVIYGGHINFVSTSIIAGCRICIRTKFHLQYASTFKVKHQNSLMQTYNSICKLIIQGVSKNDCPWKILTKENLLAIDCKHVLRTVSVLTFGSFILYITTLRSYTLVKSFIDVSKRLFNEVFESIYDYFLSQ